MSTPYKRRKGFTFREGHLHPHTSFYIGHKKGLKNQLVSCVLIWSQDINSQDMNKANPIILSNMY